ncbi:MAG: carboxypeptidase regulatory-like domain-containing protein [Gemmatimonas sp.]|jgi:hypothetical protein|uniref:carboxypeptidase regulatory-like domain-containing protein n=1 Tax=Gemmatimonas sp. TaxID=1962908 RepID=UPI00391EFDDA|nr:carboxypeptidase-like regulatory domain-containing protein [Gemmatimonadota bacterium]
MLPVWLGVVVAQPPPATLSGRVVEDSSSRPVAGAQITIGATGRAVLSDSLGAFTAVGVPVGVHIVGVRAVGYVPTELRMVFGEGQRIEVDLVISQQSRTLAGVTVTARSVPAFLRDFDARRQMAQGRFLDTTDIAPYVNSQLATLLASKVPGVRQVRFGGRTALASSRGIASMERIPGGDVMDQQLGAPKACYVQIVIDNVSVYQGQVDEPLFNADNVNLQALAAIEYYTVSNRPNEFKRAGGGACGTLVLWTKR